MNRFILPELIVRNECCRLASEDAAREAVVFHLLGVSGIIVKCESRASHTGRGTAEPRHSSLFAPSTQTDSRIQGVSRFDVHVRGKLCEDESQLWLPFRRTRSRLQQRVRAHTRQSMITARLETS